MAHNGVREKDVGILCFRNQGLPMKGIIKARWSDFHVREVSQNGELARLETFEPPVLPKVQEEPVLEIKSVFTVEELEKLNNLLENKNNTETEVILDCKDSKEARTAIHKEIRRSFPKLESATHNGENKIIVTRPRGGKNSRKDKRKDQIKYNYRFILWKEFMESGVALGHICRVLRCNQNAFHMAGTKDKRAVTVQFVSTYVEPKRLLSANKQLRNIKLGNIEIHKGEHLKLGDLKANLFKLVIRDVKVEETDEPAEKRSKMSLESVLENSAASIKRDGFLNYFGLQRFGSSSVMTHTVGVEILKENYAEAIDLILSPRDEAKHKSFLIPMRETWADTKNAQKSLQLLSKKQCPEAKLLFGLKDNPKDFVGALGRLPRTLRQMYVHAVQSFIWNRLASERITIGNEIQIGDIVQPDGTQDERLNVKEITAENIGEYTLDDVVITMPGFDVQYSPILTESLEKILGELELTHESFAGSVKDYRLPGAYRKLIARPENLETEIFLNQDDEENLIKSERDTLPALLENDYTGPHHNVQTERKESRKEPNGKTAVVVSFQLPTASYATMIVRELLHNDESK